MVPAAGASEMAAQAGLVPRPQGLIDLVLDTDAYNEIDDQFAIAYALSCPDRFRLQAIYAAPFHNRRSTGPADGMEKSYREILKLLRLAGKEQAALPVLRGATAYLPDEHSPVTNLAAEDLVRRAAAYSSERPLYVVAIGAITNVASALLMDPSIADRLVLVWLGGHAYHHTDTAEFNMKQDVAAARVVFNSAVPLVQLPCVGVTDVLTSTGPELRHWLTGRNPLCDYLLEQTVEEAERYAKGKPWSRVIWDVAAMAWLADREGAWLKERPEPRPLPGYDHRYQHPADRPPLNYVYRIHRDLVFEDLFHRLGSFMPPETKGGAAGEREA